MTSRRLFDAAMIFTIGISPIGFEYLKQNVQHTTIIDRIQSDIDNLSSQKQRPIWKPRTLVIDLLKQTLSTKSSSTKLSSSTKQQLSSQLSIKQKQQIEINKKIDMRIKILKQWKQSSFDKYLVSVLSIAGLHTMGSLLYPSVFYISILSYFILYNVDFVNDYMILSGRQSIFDRSRFEFNKINTLYIYMSIFGIGLAGLNKGFNKLNNKFINQTFNNK